MIPLSIVIATFNRSAYLLRTLESLAGQTLPAQEFEILVVNNNSTDDTPAVFAGFARQHPELRLRMVAEPVQGISTLSAYRNHKFRRKMVPSFSKTELPFRK